MIPDFKGSHIEPHQWGSSIIWSEDGYGGLAININEDGTVVILSRRTDQPTRAYELSPSDVATLARFLTGGAE